MLFLGFDDKTIFKEDVSTLQDGASLVATLNATLIFFILCFSFLIGDVNNKAICRMCKVVGVDLNGKMYKLAETGELLFCLYFALFLMCLRKILASLWMT